MKSVADLERGLPLGAASRQVAASDTATALEATASNVYDFLMRVAASLSKVQERLAEAKESLLADRAAVSTMLWPCPASTSDTVHMVPALSYAWLCPGRCCCHDKGDAARPSIIAASLYSSGPRVQSATPYGH